MLEERTIYTLTHTLTFSLPRNLEREAKDGLQYQHSLSLVEIISSSSNNNRWSAVPAFPIDMLYKALIVIILKPRSTTSGNPCAFPSTPPLLHLLTTDQDPVVAP